MKILILEDEIPAFEKLHKYLDLSFDEPWEYDWGKTVVDGKRYLTQYSYDLIFADIELRNNNIFTIFDTIEIDIPIIFCSAYNQYLLNAFRVNGIAYILKPYDRFDLENALLKYKKLFS
ncbi:MAG: response regulator, partial [Bacteroidota bacterium]